MVQKLFGPNHGREYVDMMAILVESAAVIVIYGLFFLVPATTGYPMSIIGRHTGSVIQVRYLAVVNLIAYICQLRGHHR
jgi:hypothetical protein